MAMSVKNFLENEGENQTKFPVELQEETVAILKNLDSKNFTEKLGKKNAIKIKSQSNVLGLLQINYGFIKLDDAKKNQWNIYEATQDWDGTLRIDSDPENYTSLEEIISYGWIIDLETPFESEEEFKNLVLNIPEILDGIFLLKLPSKIETKNKLPEFMGFKDEVIYLIEIKNEVDTNIISRMLKYKKWIDDNIEAFNSLLEESQNIPAHFSYEEYFYQIELIIVSPNILTPDFIKKINHQFSLIEVKKWIGKTEQLLSINKPDSTGEIREFILLTDIK